MKYFAILLLSITTFAQQPYPDTLYLTSGKSYPCMVTSIEGNKVGFIYANDIEEWTILKAIEKISLEKYGIIFSDKSGFTRDIDTLNNFIDERLSKIEEKKIIKKEQERLSAISRGDSSVINDKTNLEKIIKLNKHSRQTRFNRWSFGVLYVPYYSGIVYTLEDGYPASSQRNIYGSGVNQTNMEAQLSFALEEEFRLTFDIGYTTSYYETRYENHSRDNSGYSYDSGSLNKNDLSLFDFNLGFKYYFKNIIAEKVSVYALFAIGKQIASADEEYQQLYSNQTSNEITQNNEKEFMEDMNSPFHYNLGFGAEYFFNESLSLTSNIRFIYSKIAAKYDSRTISTNNDYSSTEDYKKSNFVTRVGLGLNFYF